MHRLAAHVLERAVEHDGLAECIEHHRQTEAEKEPDGGGAGGDRGGVENSGAWREDEKVRQGGNHGHEAERQQVTRKHRESSVQYPAGAEIAFGEVLRSIRHDPPRLANANSEFNFITVQSTIQSPQHGCQQELLCRWHVRGGLVSAWRPAWTRPRQPCWDAMTVAKGGDDSHTVRADP